MMRIGEIQIFVSPYMAENTKPIRYTNSIWVVSQKTWNELEKFVAKEMWDELRDYLYAKDINTE